MRESMSPGLYKPEFERRVLGAILQRGELIETARMLKVGKDSFVGEFNRSLFAIMDSMNRDGVTIDLAIVGEKLPGHGAELVDLSEMNATTVAFDDWCKGLKDAEALRMVCSAIDDGKGLIQAMTPPDPQNVIAGLESTLERARQVCTGRTPGASAQELAERYAQRCLDMAGATVPYFPAGTEGARAMQHHRGETHVIGANTGAGKTALAVGAVREQLDAGLRVVYFCTESPSEDIQARIAAQFCRISHYLPTMPNRDNQRMEQFFRSMQDLDRFDDRLFVRGCETKMDTPEAMEQEVRRVANEFGPVDVICVDFLQFMRTEQRFKSKLDQVNYCIEELHRLFIDQHAAGIVLAQINRDGQRAQGIPGLEHIKDSSVIAQLAHTVSFLYRADDKPTRYYSRKTRNQPSFGIELQWDGVGYTSAAKYEMPSRY